MHKWKSCLVSHVVFHNTWTLWKRDDCIIIIIISIITVISVLAKLLSLVHYLHSRHIAGLTATTAKNILKHRDSNGVFTNREQLTTIKGLGPKAYKQCAGFIRILSTNGKPRYDWAKHSLHDTNGNNLWSCIQICKIETIAFTDSMFWTNNCMCSLS